MVHGGIREAQKRRDEKKEEMGMNMCNKIIALLYHAIFQCVVP